MAQAGELLHCAWPEVHAGGIQPSQVGERREAIGAENHAAVGEGQALQAGEHRQLREGRDAGGRF